MENTIDNKGKFFAQYFGQDVRIWKELPDNKCNVGYAALTTEALPCSHLELKPISLINEEDAICAIKKLDERVYCGEYANIGDESRKTILQYFDGHFETANKIRKWNILNMFDYLRTCGYAIPYNGLSVEEQIEYGWVKLIK